MDADREANEDAFDQDAAKVLVTDEQVDRIYDAAHVVPNATEFAGVKLVSHQVWFRKSMIGRMLQMATVMRDDGMPLDKARGIFDGIWAANPEATERHSAESSRILDLVFEEIYGRE